MTRYLLDVNLLLALAVHKGGKLATLDQHIPAAAVEGGVDALEVITP